MAVPPGPLIVSRFALSALDDIPAGEGKRIGRAKLLCLTIHSRFRLPPLPRLLIHFARFGPYHHARLRAAHEALAPLGWEVMGLETAGNDATYAWDENKGAADGPRIVTAFPGKVHEQLSSQDMRRGLHPLLDALKPDAIAIAGWASVDAVACLTWCRKNHRQGIVMSETREADGRRVWWKEWIKRHRISRFSGALVGGKSHRDYLTKLGVPADRIHLGYNVVDNVYFTRESRRHQVEEEPDRPYFLASSRFIERKNLKRLVEAYALCSARPAALGERWNLCLLGDGELKASLIARCQELDLAVAACAPWELDQATGVWNSRNTVYFPGFRQIEELPRFYARAACFIHPALEEPWGLVINEAMACGLPVLSGNNVGAADELIEEGVNGWTFDAGNTEEMALCLERMALMGRESREAFGKASVRILEERYPVEVFGRGVAELLKEADRG